MTLDKNNRDLVPSPKTEKERKWLEKRRTKDAPCGACWRWCRTECKEACDRLTSDYRDAAEFEARVAAKLAEHAGSNARRGEIGTLLRPRGCSWYNADGCRETVCPCGHDIDKCAGIPFCNLYLARIAVEQEIDKEIDNER